VGFVCLPGLSGPSFTAADEPPEPVNFDRQIRPIFTQYCTSCHGGVKQAGDVSFVYANQVLPPDGWVIEPGDAEASLLIERIRSDDPDERMPPPHEHPDPVPADKIALLERWINEGAEWGPLWAMAPLNDLVAEEVKRGSQEATQKWAKQPLDYFIASAHEQRGLQHSPAAPAAEWLRRASFDLIGLPPTMEQTRAFEKSLSAATSDDDREKIYAETTDRLLASEHFGERWASVWMDLARYADSKGYEKDPHRDMWPYRDWLIRAFNADMPYDDFSIKQLAGDLLPNPTADDIIPTAFHRNTQTNTEGGTDDEEFRVTAIIDRINTTWTVWQGTTFGCVQCHAHPYDPFTHEEYYAVMALFNNTTDSDLDNDHPWIKIPGQNNFADIEASVSANLTYESTRRQRNALGFQSSEKMNWQPLTPLSAESSHGRLKVVDANVKTASGTFPPGVVYTIEFPAIKTTAIRIEILPDDEPLTRAERGSVLTHLVAEWVAADGKTEPIEFADVFADSISGDFEPRDALVKSPRGVGEYPKLNGTRAATFALSEKTSPPAGTKLRLKMNQAAATSGPQATHLRNFRWSVSADDDLIHRLDSKEFQELNTEVKSALADVQRFQGAALPVMLERPKSATRPTRLFIGGNWLERGDEIPPAVPVVFSNNNQPPTVNDRLDLARWLVSKENPLAARVWANRIWQQLFGLGLVETLEDFGSSGLPPSHPELLDHLASRIRDEHQWHLKPFLKEIVLSSTYRQTNSATEELQSKDKRNQWLARGPRTRLTAEMVRDQALLTSGLLSETIGGPSVMPPQPPGIWQAVYNNSEWKTAEGSDRYRRGLYTYWRRTSPYPSFLMFDTPTRDLCSPRRIDTNTPLQALVTLNDPVYVECGTALAKRAADQQAQLTSESKKLDAIIGWMFETVTGNSPSDLELTELVLLYAKLSEGPTAASDALGAVDDVSIKQDSVDDHDESKSKEGTLNQEALAIIANTILNLDSAFTK